MEISNLISYSEIESQRFGLKIFRGAFDDIETKQLRQTILESKADVVILRVPVLRKAQHHAYSKIGFPIIHCDTLVYYRGPLSAIEIKPLRNKLTFEELNNDNLNVLNELIPIIFDSYQNHYFSNPFLDKSKILEGYIEWAKSYITSATESKISWIAKIDDKIVGFATCKYDLKSKDCEGILYGVHPDHAGKGIYSDLIRFTQQYFKEMKLNQMLVSTQIQNFSVQKVWSKEGFVLSEAYDTYHLNSLLSYSIKDKIEFTIKIDDSIVKQFGEFSKDYNQVHFSSDYAMQNGFKGKIAHGVILASYLSKYFGMDYPGAGTLILGYSANYIMPIYLNEEYTCTILFPHISNSNGIHRATCIIESLDNAIAAIFYFDLMKR